MRENDGRKLDHQTLEEMRFRAVRWMEEGVRPTEVADRLGLRRSTVYGWLAAYRKGGTGALRARPVPGRPPKLTWEQVREVLTQLTDQGPRERGLTDELWTRTTLCALLGRDLGIQISPVTLTRMLERAGLAAARPSGPDELPPHWRTERLPLLRKATRTSGGTLYFLAHALENPGGNAPERLSMVSAAPAKGATRFLMTRGRDLTGFLSRLVLDTRGPAVVILDDRATHIRTLAAGTGGDLRLEFLPGITPW